jgi:ubiquinone/menaquinone biosynthesis C-methylase UbiE
MDDNQAIAEHYGHGSLERAIFEALSAAGKDLDCLEPADLAPVDEFHIGGRQATTEFADRLNFGPGLHLLDIGSGLGGASRYFAQERQCRVTGIDLTDEYVSLAEVLSKAVRLDKMVSYCQGSALDLPFEAGAFDGAYMLHVGMNIADKAQLFAEVRRVLKPGGVFGVYDVMRGAGESDLSFPLPWASSIRTSFVETADSYRQSLETAGFTVEEPHSRRAFALEFFNQMRARAAQGGQPPPLGLHILMGASTPQKVANMIANLERDLIAPTEIIARAV